MYTPVRVPDVLPAEVHQGEGAGPCGSLLQRRNTAHRFKVLCVPHTVHANWTECKLSTISCLLILVFIKSVTEIYSVYPILSH